MCKILVTVYYQEVTGFYHLPRRKSSCMETEPLLGPGHTASDSGWCTTSAPIMLFASFVGCATLVLLCISTQSSCKRMLLESSQPSPFKEICLEVYSYNVNSSSIYLKPIYILTKYCLYESREYHRASFNFLAPSLLPREGNKLN